MSKYREIVLEALQEAKQVGNLYHTTDLDGFEEIIKTNKLISDRPNGISFSRDKHNWYGNGEVTLIFDGDKLSENNKLYPFSYTTHEYLGGWFEHPKDGNSETSLLPRGQTQGKWPTKDQVDGNGMPILGGDKLFILPNINKYLLGALVNMAHVQSSEDVERIFKLTQQFDEKYNLPIKYIDDYIPKIRDNKGLRFK